MKKIAILGCENSHANAFLKLLEDGKYPQIKCVGVYSKQQEAAEKLKARFGVEVMPSADAMVGRIDGLVITARDGSEHYALAKPYIESGIPMFIDKPFTCDCKEAVDFVQEAKKKGVRLCGGSVAALWPDTLKLKEFAKKGVVLGGSIAAPIHMNSAYSGFWFYAQHLVQMVLAVFGKEICSVSACRIEDRVSVLFHYDRFDVSGFYLSENRYAGSVVSEEGCESCEIEFCEETFAEEMNAIAALMDGAPMAENYEDLVQPIFLIEAIQKAYQSGKTIEMKEIVL